MKFPKKTMFHLRLKVGNIFPADFADFFRRFKQVFQILFLKIRANLRKNLRNLREKYYHFFLSCTEIIYIKKNILINPLSQSSTYVQIQDFLNLLL
jgi:hypothetical protein